jgi:acetyl-CoA acetyltransferase
VARGHLSGRCVIAGIGHTAFGSLPGRSTLSLIAEAVRAAIQDAGIEKNEIDAVFVKPPTSSPELQVAQRACEALGLEPRLAHGWDQGGAAPAAMVAHAVMAIDAGLCEVALLCFADNPKSGTRQAYGRARTSDDTVFGWLGTPPAYAMAARRHMQQYGTTYSQLGAVAVASRRHGAANPNAQLRKPLTLEDHANGRLIASPFRRDDCALVSDGGAALIVMSAERAKKRQGAQPVPILGFGGGQSSYSIAQRRDLTTTRATASGAAAFQMAGLRPADIDLVQLYDCFSIVPIMTLEDYGFCRKGEGGSFVADGRLEIDGDLPMNTAGGLLSETGMPGMQLIIEAVRQLRGTANLQAKRARTCVVSNQGGIMQSHSTLVLAQ